MPKSKAPQKRKRHRKSDGDEDGAEAPEINEGYNAGDGLLANVLLRDVCVSGTVSKE